MINLYEYDNATYEECIEDLYQTIAKLYDSMLCDYFEVEVLENRAIRIKNIIQRLKDLGINYIGE